MRINQQSENKYNMEERNGKVCIIFEIGIGNRKNLNIYVPRLLRK